MLGSELIAQKLQEHGIKRIYIYPGGTIGPILDVVKNFDIEIFTARHEQGAGYAALAVGRLTRKAQVVMVTSGPGVTNVLTPIADAYFDSTPMVIFAGQVGTKDMKKNLPIRQRGFQEIDTIGIVKPITKAQFLPKSVLALNDIIDEAFRISEEGRPGPVVIDIPMDIQRSDVENIISQKKSDIKQKSVNDEQINHFINLLKKSKRPIIISGHGVILSNSNKELREFATSFQIPVSSSFLGLGSFPTNSPLSLGFHGHTGSQFANKAIYESDLVMVFGSRLDVRQTGSRVESFVPNGKVVQIDIDDDELENCRVETNLKINSNVKNFLKSLNSKLKNISPTDLSEWNNQIKIWKSEFKLSYEKTGNLKPQYIIESINNYTINHKVICVTGVGSHQQWVARHFDFNIPSRIFLSSGGHGAMGFDLPVAIGAKMLKHDYEVICFVGDGSLQMNIQELGTISTKKLPVKIFVLNNNRLGIVSQFQKITWKDDPSCGRIKNPDFAAIAKAYGIDSYTIKTWNDVEPIIKTALANTGPVLVNCLIDPDEDVSPMLLGGQTMDKMWPNYE